MGWRRPCPIQVTLVVQGASAFFKRYAETSPLYGDWDLLRFVTLADTKLGVGDYYSYGFRLASEGPYNDATWGAAERLWYGSSVGAYVGDGVVALEPGSTVYEGPFRLKTRGRRLCVQFQHSGAASRALAVTLVLQQVWRRARRRVQS